jgi:hypothetical protein
MFSELIGDDFVFGFGWIAELSNLAIVWFLVSSICEMKM